MNFKILIALLSVALLTSCKNSSGETAAEKAELERRDSISQKRVNFNAFPSELVLPDQYLDEYAFNLNQMLEELKKPEVRVSLEAQEKLKLRIEDLKDQKPSTESLSPDDKKRLEEYETRKLAQIDSVLAKKVGK